MRPTTEYAKKVKIELVKQEKTQEWLMAQVTERTGLFVDSGYLGKIFTGQRKAPKIVKAINEVLELEEDDYRANTDKQTATA